MRLDLFKHRVLLRSQIEDCSLSVILFGSDKTSKKFHFLDKSSELRVDFVAESL